MGPMRPRQTCGGTQMRVRFGVALIVGVVGSAMLTGCATNTPEVAPEPAEEATSESTGVFEGADPADYIIPAGLDAQSVADAVVEGAVNSWVNAGANDSLRDRLLASDDAFDTVLAVIAAENAVTVTENLFTAGWESMDSLVSLATGAEKSNFETLQWYQATAWNDEEPENIEGYRSWMEVEAVRELDDGDGDASTRTILVDYTNHTNSDKNVGPDPQRSGGTLEFAVVSDGTQERLSRFEVTI